MKLTPEQIAIIRTRQPRVQVLAYAGTGKTTTLCARIKWLTDRRHVQPKQILVLAFSNDSVDVLDTRLSNAIEVQTFHSFGKSCLLSGGSKSTPINDTQRVNLVRKAIKLCPAERKTILNTLNCSLVSAAKKIAQFLKRIGGNKEIAHQLVNDSNSQFYALNQCLPELKAINLQYKKLRKQYGYLEFRDMLHVDSSALAKALKHIQYVFIDECQDLNADQIELQKAIMSIVPNVMVFGDPFQSIFGFAGAKFWNLEHMVDDAQTLQLTNSFRLTQRSADAACAVLNDVSTTPLRIIGRCPGQKPVFVRCTVSDREEAKVIGAIQRLVDAGIDLNKIAILARHKRRLNHIEQALRQQHIDTKPLYRKQDQRHLECVINLVELAQQWKTQVGTDDKSSRRNKERAILTSAAVHFSVDASVRAACRRLLEKTLTCPTLEGQYIGATKVYKKLLRTDDKLTKNIKTELAQWEPICNTVNSTTELKLRVNKTLSASLVTTTTIHGAKGREWDYVFVLGVVEGSLPDFRSIECGDTSEERRLLYVALSRTRERTFVFDGPLHRADGHIYQEQSQFMTRSVLKKFHLP
ncbi:MAG: ATP-dependent helicase [Undibacterium sp.]|nr:ATP-dependent helicase [Undibacterium sp.]